MNVQGKKTTSPAARFMHVDYPLVSLKSVLPSTLYAAPEREQTGFSSIWSTAGDNGAGASTKLDHFTELGGQTPTSKMTLTKITSSRSKQVICQFWEASYSSVKDNINLVDSYSLYLDR